MHKQKDFQMSQTIIQFLGSYACQNLSKFLILFPTLEFYTVIERSGRVNDTPKNELVQTDSNFSRNM